MNNGGGAGQTAPTQRQQQQQQQRPRPAAAQQQQQQQQQRPKPAAAQQQNGWADRPSASTKHYASQSTRQPSANSNSRHPVEAPWARTVSSVEAEWTQCTCCGADHQITVERGEAFATNMLGFDLAACMSD